MATDNKRTLTPNNTNLIAAETTGATAAATNTRRKRTSIRDSVGARGPLWLPDNVLPGYKVRWAGVSDSNPYKLYQLMEIGYGPLTDEQIKKVFGLVPTGFMNQNRTEHGSFITKQSGRVTHYLMCIPLEDAADIDREKAQIRKEKNTSRVNNLKNDPHLTSADLTVGANIVKTWN